MAMKIDGSKVSQSFFFFVIKPLLTMVSSLHVKFSLVHVMFCFESSPLEYPNLSNTGLLAFS